MPINIHNKQYYTVAERIEMAKDHIEKVETEVLQHDPIVVIKATVTLAGKSFTGISAANPSKAIEKQSPYEVAETSAVGRALAFAGIGIASGIASAEEMDKAIEDDFETELVDRCAHCGTTSKYHRRDCPNFKAI